ncbi:DUF1499 domain-containing protein [Desulfosarcina sp.]
MDLWSRCDGIHGRSASRVGHFDFGVNRKRVEKKGGRPYNRPPFF